MVLHLFLLIRHDGCGCAEVGRWLVNLRALDLIATHLIVVRSSGRGRAASTCKAHRSRSKTVTRSSVKCALAPQRAIVMETLRGVCASIASFETL